MKTEELVSAVRQSTGIDTTEHARAAVSATLTVLGTRLAGGETRDLAAQLPAPLSEVLPESGVGERFGINEFYRRVADNEAQGCPVDQARQHSRAVVSAIKTAVTDGEFDNLTSQLPADYADLIGEEHIQHH